MVCTDEVGNNTKIEKIRDHAFVSVYLCVQRKECSVLIFMHIISWSVSEIMLLKSEVYYTFAKYT